MFSSLDLASRMNAAMHPGPCQSPATWSVTCGTSKELIQSMKTYEAQKNSNSDDAWYDPLHPTTPPADSSLV